jgi:hypothetical protein
VGEGGEVVWAARESGVVDVPPLCDVRLAEGFGRELLLGQERRLLAEEAVVRPAVLESHSEAGSGAAEGTFDEEGPLVLGEGFDGNRPVINLGMRA